ncbi:hypothetical protein BDB00DRAFT_868120 [Zychaea mexicana]|uniref:uncharacterized protein n=1 Tax=Zychaea mexicana TaxID=64656 RepID=UPI0022FF33AE|nr:uncharacterized protein BDB00DRAFT_868120 [Zychaea mexicana]KAI9497986.1 hypothetical protein BDB00DRAFT_868120 [Zychaea mexicana]
MKWIKQQQHRQSQINNSNNNSNMTVRNQTATTTTSDSTIHRNAFVTDNVPPETTVTSTSERFNLDNGNIFDHSFPSFLTAPPSQQATSVVPDPQMHTIRSRIFQNHLRNFHRRLLEQESNSSSPVTLFSTLLTEPSPSSTTMPLTTTATAHNGDDTLRYSLHSLWDPHVQFSSQSHSNNQENTNSNRNNAETLYGYHHSSVHPLDNTMDATTTTELSSGTLQASSATNAELPPPVLQPSIIPFSAIPPIATTVTTLLLPEELVLEQMKSIETSVDGLMKKEIRRINKEIQERRHYRRQLNFKGGQSPELRKAIIDAAPQGDRYPESNMGNVGF